MYFDKPGKDNTQQALKLAAARGKELGIEEVVLASTTGFTAYQAIEIFDGPRITAVTYHSGFKEPFKSQMPAEVRTDLQEKGIRVVAASHALSGVERSIAKKHSGGVSGFDYGRHLEALRPGRQGCGGSRCDGGRRRSAERQGYHCHRRLRPRSRCSPGAEAGPPEQFFRSADQGSGLQTEKFLGHQFQIKNVCASGRQVSGSLAGRLGCSKAGKPSSSEVQPF